MSLEKAIKHGKEKRKAYRRSKAFDSSCRNHGGCGYCEGNRTRFDTRARQAAEEEIKEFLNPGYLDEYYDEYLMDEKYKRMANDNTIYHNAREASDGIIERLEGELATVTANAMEYIDKLTEFIMERDLWDEFMKEKLNVEDR